MSYSYDVIIIGAGEAGVFAGYELARLRPELKVLILEQGAEVAETCVAIRGTGAGVYCLNTVVANAFVGVDFTGCDDHPHWQSGLIVQLDIDDKVDISFIPVKVEGLGITLAKGEDYDTLMSTFKEQSDNLNNGVWLEGWAEFCEAVKDRYIGNISRAFSDKANSIDNEIFCGRMHCEAHKDVIDWLCKHYWEQREEI